MLGADHHFIIFYFYFLIIYCHECVSRKARKGAKTMIACLKCSIGTSRL